MPNGDIQVKVPAKLKDAHRLEGRMITRDELEELGFRWTQETELECQDGERIRVTPSTYLSSRENQGSGERFRKALRLYDVTHADDRRETLVSELEIEKRLRIDWSAKRDAWVQAVGELLGQIQRWAQQRGWTVAEQRKGISEEYLGDYQVPFLFIQTPNG